MRIHNPCLVIVLSLGHSLQPRGSPLKQMTGASPYLATAAAQPFTPTALAQLSQPSQAYNPLTHSLPVVSNIAQPQGILPIARTPEPEPQLQPPPYVP